LKIEIAFLSAEAATFGAGCWSIETPALTQFSGDFWIETIGSSPNHELDTFGAGRV
jgi:hypothetical protein